ncbi:MAG: hypothetical protein AAB600_01445 [Patescibacteria group bacterium]
MIYFAKAVSIIFHPAILILFLPFLVVYRQTESSFYALKWQIFSALFVFLAGLLVFLGEAAGVFSDSDLTKRNERNKFYTMVIILLALYIVAVVFFKGIFSPLVIISFGILFGVVLFTIANHLIKISIHSGAVCAFVISLGILYGINIFFAVVWIVPLTIWARIMLKRHTIYEAISGGTLGGIITIVTYLIGKNFL